MYMYMFTCDDQQNLELNLDALIYSLGCKSKHYMTHNLSIQNKQKEWKERRKSKFSCEKSQSH